MEVLKTYAGILHDSMYWWLSKKRPFILNDEYEIKLLYINRRLDIAKIQITSLKDGSVQEDMYNVQ